MQIVIYTKNSCPACVTTKQLLKSKGLKFAEYDVGVLENALGLLTVYPEARQMPQCFINGQRVGGLAGLQVALKELGL